MYLFTKCNIDKSKFRLRQLAMWISAGLQWFRPPGGLRPFSQPSTSGTLMAPWLAIFLPGLTENLPLAIAALRLGFRIASQAFWQLRQVRWPDEAGAAYQLPPEWRRMTFWLICSSGTGSGGPHFVRWCRWGAHSPADWSRRWWRQCRCPSCKHNRSKWIITDTMIEFSLKVWRKK